MRKVINKKKIAKTISELWDPLSDEQREYLVENMDIHVFKKNEIIFRENELPEYIMCLLEGKVKVYKDGVGGRYQIIRMINEMGFFGYRAAFANENYHTGASAFENSTICLIPIKTIKKLIKENNQLAIFFLGQLARMLGQADMLAVNLTQKHIRARLADSLLTLKENYGVEEDGSTLSIYLSREDLANMSNMTTSNAIRTLSSFAFEGLIAIDGRKIKLINTNDLIKISNMG